MIRPGARAWIARRRGAIGAAALGVAALASFGGPALAGGVVPAALLAISLGAALWLAREAATRARLRAGEGPGLVAVREGRVGYLGPAAGGLVDLDALVAVELARRRDGAVWILRPAGAPPLEIPVAAEGADALLDALTALPGFSPARAADALDGPADAHAILWRRRGRLPAA